MSAPFKSFLHFFFCFFDSPLAHFRIHSCSQTSSEIFSNMNSLFCERVMEFLRISIDRNEVNTLNFELIMWFTAFFPEPPTPTTLILAKASISGVMLGMNDVENNNAGLVSTPIIPPFGGARALRGFRGRVSDKLQVALK
jgi:hypothetical protein